MDVSFVGQVPRMQDGEAKRMLRAEMVRRDISYEDLVQRLADAGVKETSASLRNKLSRGSFTADFFLKALTAIGVTSLRLVE
jgi:hypothetical protein